MQISRITRGMSGRRRGLVALLSVAALAIAACGGDDASAAGTNKPAAATGAPAPAGANPDWQAQIDTLATMPLDELYKHAIDEEDGKVVFFNGDSVIPPDRAGLGAAFQKVYPGMDVQLSGDGTAGDMIAKAAAEVSAGRQPPGDLLWGSVEYVIEARNQGVIANWNPPEAAAYPVNLKGPDFVATDYTLHGIAWNTDRVSDEEAPKSFDDLLDPKWKGRIIAEPRIAIQLTALASHRFDGDEAAAEAFAKGLADNDVTFIPRYPTLAQQLASGEYDVCFNCNAYATKDLIDEGAPLKFMQSEVVALPDAQMIFANPVHPYGAMLFARWMISAEGQNAWAAGARNAALPGITPTGKSIDPDKKWVLTTDDVVKVFPTWNDKATALFNLR